MKTTSVTERLAGLGGAKWGVHLKARDLIKAGADIVEMTIGEPDVPVPDALVEATVASLRAQRTGYSNGRGEAGLLDALAARYSASRGRAFEPGNFLCFPGTQTALFAAMAGVAEAGDEALVGDPMYATYEGVVRASGAEMVPVPLRPEKGFRMQAADIAARITPRSRAILLTTPHNPTGAILTAADIAEIGQLAIARDLWIISDEVYEELIFDGARFVSPLADPELADRVIGVSSISKSHAAPGFRSGWCVGPAAFCEALLPYSETMLFGNQPFIADMTEKAIRDGSEVAPGMAARFSGRATLLADRLEAETDLKVHRPEAGMFALINVSATGLDGEAYAWDLLQAGVAAMPGSAFGDSLKDWVRVALTINDTDFGTAVSRIIEHANSKSREVA
ncbi:aminotransferase class I/II-fold pyridoxal phosphate-dependent enzyme [Ruegeria sp. HKCCD6228]|uniref:pyridoxal phosphate-dependent aminotransferase n=1 Tax=unclassified Ruegeria TaxID=2625375 RepID=UPI001488F0AF|nr:MULTISPECIES: pyridoxal phosphate-dependent aminotransferase [unclassified Ruegeria]NOD97186.1 aminotransferase class I/II-fold pyridoxal phosphate-dependent enzyme [Ruegeria sp. HKCCD6228]